MIDLPVIKAFTHEGRAFTVGETITVTPITAAALHHRGLVSLTRGYRVAAVAAAPVQTPKRRRNAYRRRDLTAETP